MSHDLQFQVQNGDGTMASPDRPIQGELDHLPDRAAPGVAGGATGKSGGTLEFVQNQLKQSAHPMVIIFHCLFKAAALFFYIFGGWFVGSGKGETGGRFISLTVICILLLAADFWVVKNVTGRLLVGLRWWNKVEEDDTKWIFEAAENKRINPFDRRVFWTVLYATPVVWTALFFLGVLKFNLNWLLIVVIALSLSGANVYGYYKCSKDQKQQLQHMMQQRAQEGMVAVMRSNMLSMLTGNNAAAAGSGGNNNFV